MSRLNLRSSEPERPETSGPAAVPGSEPDGPQAPPQRDIDPAEMPGVPVEPGEPTEGGEHGSGGAGSHPINGGTSTSGTTPVPAKAPRQTLAGRVWVALACAAVLLVLLIIFIAENSRSVTISFLGANGHISEALALLIAVVVGIVITLLVGSARIVQLSLEVRRHRRRLRELGELPS